MRLTHLKLAGFKSFVDPTTLHIHGQRVGVVGPNGCGKSNVMESVRWVLGESSAKEMRADAMDAVIFNGSGNRKPISRASVELIFDNSLGSAAGEWSQYAEISVKRVIERDKGSTYYINNTVVRRRDVADLFLGTGLGGRAYAIIGQNTISRIVEAKPEELRIFLEEAAGISKYKERRRETELRLRDTRENLTRVEDILHELDKQITRLQSQAVVANQYHDLQSLLNITRGQVWLLKKRDASTHWEKTQRNVEAIVNALEAQIASLRHTENTLETVRQVNASASEALNMAQAQYYEANAEVSTLENQVKNTTEARERMQLQLQQLLAQRDKNTQQTSSTQEALVLAQQTLNSANSDFSVAELAIKQAREAIPAKSQVFQASFTAFNESQAALSKAEETLRLEQANIGHLNRAVADATSQTQRLQQALASLELIEDSALAKEQEDLTVFNRHILALEQAITESQTQEQQFNDAVKQLRADYLQKQQSLNIAQAEINSLEKLQSALKNTNNQTALTAWLKTHQLENNQRIWQVVRIQKGWETALEAVLGSRLNALVLDSSVLSKADALARPPAALVIAKAATQSNASESNTQLTSMRSIVDNIEPIYQAVVNEWLSRVYLLGEGDSPEALLPHLSAGECLVNPQGDIYTPNSVSYFGAQSSLHGVLERQAQLDDLQRQQPVLQQQVDLVNAQIQRQETGLQTIRAHVQQQQAELKTVSQQAQQLNLAISQKKQAQQNTLQRQKSLEAEIALLNTRQSGLQAESQEKQGIVVQVSKQLSELQSNKAQAEAQKQTLQNQLNEARNKLQQLERDLQEKNFNLKLNNNKINELNNKLESLLEEKNALNLRVQEFEQTLQATQMETLKTNLTSALNRKQTQEQALATARNHMAECETALLNEERNRMQQEQQLHPMRDKLEASRLAEQEARLHFEQCQAALSACNMHENTLTEHLNALQSAQNNTVIKLSDLERKRQQLEQDIANLGAVNLAAIQELETEQTRKQYLDSQCADLTEATNTLEDAIRKIDRETRGRLQHTFDEANKHFNDLFTTLFGGGNARLELLGEEILDTGMQVFAQPPGKKNSTIHLLSGGEKALTALALVFALFRLNPAPFCLMDEVDAPLDDSNTERFCAMVKKMSENTQFMYVSHNKITMEMAQQLIGVTMQESGVSRIVDVDMEAAIKMTEEAFV